MEFGQGSQGEWQERFGARRLPLSEHEMSNPAGYYDDLTYGSRGTPFMEATLKIKRAERHLNELANAARELPRRRGYSFVIAPRPGRGNIEIIFMPENGMPMEFGAVVGDAIHNIRAAFDY